METSKQGFSFQELPESATNVKLLQTGMVQLDTGAPVDIDLFLASYAPDEMNDKDLILHNDQVYPKALFRQRKAGVDVTQYHRATEHMYMSMATQAAHGLNMGPGQKSGKLYKMPQWLYDLQSEYGKSYDKLDSITKFTLDHWFWYWLRQDGSTDKIDEADESFKEQLDDNFEKTKDKAISLYLAWAEGTLLFYNRPVPGYETYAHVFRMIGNHIKGGAGAGAGAGAAAGAAAGGGRTDDTILAQMQLESYETLFYGPMKARGPGCSKVDKGGVDGAFQLSRHQSSARAASRS